MLTQSNSKRRILSCVCSLRIPAELLYPIPVPVFTPVPIVVLFRVQGNKIAKLFAYLPKLYYLCTLYETLSEL